jgi:tRNA-uridine 2-sulfurtransferase
MTKAIALLSGGLDSTLAILAVLKQGIGVNAIKFQTLFDCDVSPSNDLLSLGRRFGFETEICNTGEKFLAIVKNPPHGYGKNMNPCIDCRILMLKEAKLCMDMEGADFIVTGEVLGQRPMSQRRDMLYHIDKEAGVAGKVLRPLSAKLLKITSPEAEGIIEREMLYGLSGRSRKPQMALAGEFGLDDYPAPAGGCLLTEPNYAHRLKDLLTFDPSPSARDIKLLRMGRHFRLSPVCKVIVGRDEAENDAIEALSAQSDPLLRVDGFGSPVTLVTGTLTNEALKIAASLCARYSDAKNIAETEVTIRQANDTFRILVSPAGNEIIEDMRVEKTRKDKTAKA